MRRLHAALAASSLLLGGCADSGILGLVLEDAGTEFRTDSGRYTLGIQEGVATLEIPFTFRNHTGRTIYVVNCNGLAPPVLEKREGERWVVAYVPAVPACLSPAIEIRDHETYHGTVHVQAWLPASLHRPKFEVDELEGTYRLVWHGVLYDFDPNRYPFGEEVELELRTGEEFFIDDPRS